MNATYLNADSCFGLTLDRLHFNRVFTISLDGKYKGWSTLESLGILDAFLNRLAKRLRIYSKSCSKNEPDVIVLTVKGHTIKLYHR